MLQLNISNFPNRIESLDHNDIIPTLKSTETQIQIILDKLNPNDSKHHNNLKSLNKCLLLILFLKNQYNEFNLRLKTLKKKEVKSIEKAQMYYDLTLFHSNIKTVDQNTIIDNIEYDKLLKAHLKWKLLIKNLVSIRYEAQINSIEKSDWVVKPERLLILLELFIDWKYRIPNKEKFLALIEKKIALAKKIATEKSEVNTFYLSEKHIKLTKTKLAIWDTGVDPLSISNISNDLKLYFDKNCNLTSQPLVELKNINEEDIEIHKGLLDIRGGTKSLAAEKLMEKLSKFDKNEMANFKNRLNQLVLYAHGTTVASVAGKSLSHIEIVPIRITFDSNQAFPTMYTEERIGQEIKMYKEVFQWINVNNIKIVNMSWCHRKQDIETSLKNTGITDKKKRAELAKNLFTTLKDELYNHIRICKNTLFVVAAGNSNIMIDESDSIPNSFDLPNLIVVGAVNNNKLRTGFTTIGQNVDIYAHGAYVPAIFPGNHPILTSGTSIAAPQIAHLAAQLLAIIPSLSPKLVKDYILKTANLDINENILLINSQKAIDFVLSLSNN